MIITNTEKVFYLVYDMLVKLLFRSGEDKVLDFSDNYNSRVVCKGIRGEKGDILGYLVQLFCREEIVEEWCIGNYGCPDYVLIREIAKTIPEIIESRKK